MKIIEEYTDSQLEDIFDSLDSEDESGEARRAYAAVASRLGFRRQRNTIRKVALKVSAVVAAAACAAGLFFGELLMSRLRKGRCTGRKLRFRRDSIVI